MYKLSDASEGVTCGYMDHSDNNGCAARTLLYFII